MFDDRDAGDNNASHKRRRRKLSREDVLSTKSMKQMLWSAACSIRGEKDAPKFVKVVTLAQAAENDFNLSPSRYLDITECETYRPIPEILAELDALERKPKAQQ